MDNSILQKLLFLGGKGGASPSKIISGTFKGVTENAAMDISIPYTGNGYPVSCRVYPIEGGWKSGADITDLVQKQAIIMFAMVKGDFSSEPTYSGNTEPNHTNYMSMYKNSDEDASVTSGSIGKQTQTFSTSAAIASTSACVRFSSKTQMSVFIAGTSYGFPAGIEFAYQITYSE